MSRLRCRLALSLLLGVASGCDRGAEGTGQGGGSQPSSVSTPSTPPSASAIVDAAPPEPERAESIVIYAGGDVNLGRGLGQLILADEKYDPFVEIAPVWSDADLRFVNLESQLSDQNGETQSPNNRLVFTGPPGGAKTLAQAGVHVVSVANNHAWDYGKKALGETLSNLDEAGVRHAGANMKRGDFAYEPVILEVKGWRIAVFAVTHIWNQNHIHLHEGRHHVAWARFDKLEAPFKKARAENDLVLVSYHGGSEYVDVPMRWSDEFVRAIMHHGADAMIGHHPHVPQGIAWFGDRPVFYSLGNFVFGMHRDHQWTGIGMLARLEFHRDGSLKAKACPFHIFGHKPMPFSSKSERGQKGLETIFRRHLRTISIATGRSEVGEAGEHSCVDVGPPLKKRPRPWKYPASKKIPRNE